MKWHPFLSTTSSRKNSKPVLFDPMAEHNYKNCKSKKNKNRKNNFRTKSILPSLPYHPLWLISSFRRCSKRSCRKNYCNIELAGRNPDKNTNRKSFRRKFLQLCNNFPSKNRRFCSIFLSRRMKDTRNWKMVRTRKNRNRPALFCKFFDNLTGSYIRE